MYTFINSTDTFLLKGVSFSSAYRKPDAWYVLCVCAPVACSVENTQTQTPYFTPSPRKESLYSSKMHVISILVFSENYGSIMIQVSQHGWLKASAYIKSFIVEGGDGLSPPDRLHYAFDRRINYGITPSLK